MNQEMNDLPQAETADPDGVQVALRAAQTLWSRGDTSESLKWLRKAAESASDEGADLRSLQLAKAAAELRAKLLRGGDVSRGNACESRGARPDGDGARSSFPPAAFASVSSPPVSSPPVSSPPVSSPPASFASGAFAAASYAQEASEVSSGNGEPGAGHPSRPVTATQYPSHRPRQRIGLTSSIPGAASASVAAPSGAASAAATGSASIPPPSPRELSRAREEARAAADAHAAVPSWSADAERRVSAAPPPLPLSAHDDYEELEAEPDDEPAGEPGDDPGSIWNGRSEPWHLSASGAEARGEPPARGEGLLGSSAGEPPVGAPPSAPSSTLRAASNAPSIFPPPLPPRGAFADDDDDDDSLEPLIARARDGAPSAGDAGASAASPRWTQSDLWARESRLAGWDQDSGSSWSAELGSAAWGSAQGAAHFGMADSGMADSGLADSGLAEPGLAEPGLAEPGSASPGGLAAGFASSAGLPIGGEPSAEAARAKLTARVHHQAVRVSFAPDARVPGQYVVRPLREGEKAASGERVALLVALEPGVPLV